MAMNDINAWADTANDLGLRVISLLGEHDDVCREIVIIKSDDIERGYLWVKEHRLFGHGELNKGLINGDLSPQEALALLAVLARNGK